MTTKTGILRLTTDPNRFFADRSSEPGLRGPLILVTGLVVLTIFHAYPLLRGLTASDLNSHGPFVLIVLVSGIAGGLSINLIWLLYAAILHGMSAYFDAQGRFRNTVKLIGWGFLPLLLAAAFSVLASGFAIAEIPPSKLSGGASAIEVYRSHPYVRLAKLLRVVFTVWAGHLWMFGLKHARNISLRQSGIVVSVLVISILSWEVWNIWSALG